MGSDTVGVVAHSGKTLGGGLGELREVLAAAGCPNPLWYEVSRGRDVPAATQQALDDGVRILLVWGGDGVLRRAVETVAGTGVVLAVLPAGTGNLLAGNLGIPKDIAQAVDIALHGDRRVLDTVKLNGERFSIMAGAGLDATTMRDADDGLKDRIGKAAYLWTGSRHLSDAPVRCKVDVDGRRLYRGKVTCVLVGNMSEVVGGVDLFGGSRPDDGIIEVGVVSAKSRTQWLRTLGRVVVGRAEDSPFVVIGRGRSIRVRFDQKLEYELDGSARGKASQLRIKVRPRSVVVCVPRAESVAQSSESKAS